MALRGTLALPSSPPQAPSRKEAPRHSSFLGAGLRPSPLSALRRSAAARVPLPRPNPAVVCGILDYLGGDLIKFDLGRWAEDVDKHGAIAMYTPPEGGYEGRYVTRLKALGYHVLAMSARGLGDPEAYLSKFHGVRPAHLGKQAITCTYMPPEVDYRLSLLPTNSKGLILWLIEAQVLSKTELQYLALLPAIQPRVKVVAECGSWRDVRWKPLREVAGLDTNTEGN